MKKLTIIFLIACAISGCTSKKKLSREKASNLIKEAMKFPRVIDYDIYSADPEFAKIVIVKRLEKVAGNNKTYTKIRRCWQALSWIY